MKGDSRFIAESGYELLSAPQALLKGALETVGGIHLVTGYPTASFPYFFDACLEAGPFFNDKGIVAHPAADESLAVAMVRGAQQAGCRAIAVLGAGGLRASAATLHTAAAAGAHSSGGAMVVVVDEYDRDGASGTQLLLQQLGLPILEPQGLQELKDWVYLGLHTSAHSGRYVAMRLPPSLARSGATVELKSNHWPVVNARFKETVGTAHPAASSGAGTASVWAERGLELAKGEARRFAINRIEHKPHKGETVPLGFIAAGRAYGVLAAALESLGLGGKFPILKLGMSWPLDAQILREFVIHTSNVVVIEEAGPFVEQQIQAYAASHHDPGVERARIWGKTFPAGLRGFEDGSDLDPAHLARRVIPLLLREGLSLPWLNESMREKLKARLAELSHKAPAGLSPPIRAESFCPGCPQRDLAMVLGGVRADLNNPLYMQQEHRMGPIQLTVQGDVGCASLWASWSGAAGCDRGVGAGVAQAFGAFVIGKQLTVMGHDTFFQNGRMVIHDAILRDGDMTFVLVDNQLAAFEGSAPPGRFEQRLPDGHFKRPLQAMRRQYSESLSGIIQVLRTLVGRDYVSRLRIVRVDPSDQEALRQAVEHAVLAKGVKVILLDKPCALTAHRVSDHQQQRELDDHGYVFRQTRMQIVPEVCEHCMECTRQTGCPALDVTTTDYGPKVRINDALCVNDGACARIRACPAFERVTVTRSHRPSIPLQVLADQDLPAPAPVAELDRGPWSCLLAGVAGQGVETSQQVLAYAAKEMGYQVFYRFNPSRYFRAGSVSGWLVVDKEARKPVEPAGPVDLLLGMEPLEAVRVVQGEGSEGGPTASHGCVVNSRGVPTLQAMSRGVYEPCDPSLEWLEGHSDPGRYLAGDWVESACKYFGHERFMNMVMLGLAFQKGELPLTQQALERAIRRVIANDPEANLRAFRLGRRLALSQRPSRERSPMSTARLFRRKMEWMRGHFEGPKQRGMVRRLIRLVREVQAAMRQAAAPRHLLHSFIVYATDCAVWSGEIGYARRYAQQVLKILRQDSPPHAFAMTAAVIQNLGRLMLIKDPVYVALLLTDAQKSRRDLEKFNIDPQHGDRIRYRRDHNIHLSLLGGVMHLGWRSTNWQLRLLARCRWLRLWPTWSRRDRALLDWYESLIEQARWSDDGQYATGLKALAAAAKINGFREVRWAKTSVVQQEVKALWAP